MKRFLWNLALAAFVASGTAACKGGGGTPTPTPAPTPAPTPVPTLNVTLSAGSANVDLAEGQSKDLEFTASYSGSTADPIVAMATSDNAAVIVNSVTAAPDGSYKVALSTKPSLPGGTRTATVKFRLCRDSGCGTTYPGSSRDFAVTLDVKLDDWVTFQRNAAHTGAVNVAYDASKFTKAWDWFPPGVQLLLPPATHGGKIFMTALIQNGGGNQDASAFALNGSNGSTIWETSLGVQRRLGGPAYSNGRVHISSMYTSSNDNPQWVLDETDGSVLRKMLFPSQWNSFNQPTPYGQSVFMTAGYFGNYLYSFNPANGAKNWEAQGSAGDIWYGQAPAVDQNYVYYYSGKALDLFNRSSGALVKSIPDPFFAWQGYDWPLGPVLDGKGNIFLFSSPAIDRTFGHYIVAYSAAGSSHTWRSGNKYASAMAYADGTIYALRYNAKVLDAIDAATGTVKWSTNFSEPGDLRHNVIVTKNHVFFSSDEYVYAVDLVGSDHAIVWKQPTGGMLSITPGNLLLVAGHTSLTLTAYKLD
jgi:outer membrane protein assembly factor BamB